MPEPQHQPGADDAPSDAQLAQRIDGGDREAASELIGRYQGPIRGFLLRLTGRPDLADDLTQDTLIRMLQNAGRYDPQYAMRTWAMTIARRLWINFNRKAERRNVSGEFDHRPGNSPDPASVTSRNDELANMRQLLEDALQQLSESQRLALVLFHQQGLSVDEVAHVMEMPPGTIKSHLHRGRAAMRRILGPDADRQDM